MRRKLLAAALFLVILVGAVIIFNKGVIFQRGDPIPYVSKMFSLNDNKQYSRVFDDEDIYITRKTDYDDFISYVESAYDVTYSGQLGSSYLFASEEKTLYASTEIYWGSYLVWELKSI